MATGKLSGLLLTSVTPAGSRTGAPRFVLAPDPVMAYSHTLVSCFERSSRFRPTLATRASCPFGDMVMLVGLSRLLGRVSFTVRTSVSAQVAGSSVRTSIDVTAPPSRNAKTTLLEPTSTATTSENARLDTAVRSLILTDTRRQANWGATKQAPFPENAM